MSAFTFAWIASTLEEIEEQVLRAGIDIKVSRIGTSRWHCQTVWILPQEAKNELDSRVAEFGLLDPDLVIGKLRMNESRKLLRRPQIRQMHRGHIPSEVRNTRESPNVFLYVEKLRESTACEGYKS